MTGSEQWSTENDLHALGTATAGAAWSSFLRRFTPLIISVVRQYQHEQSSQHDCYLHVCEKLSDDDFARLRAWRRVNGVRFASWLRVVVANLCVDWMRREYGRQRRFRCVAGLPDLERAVFALRFEQKLGIQACYEAISTRFPGVTEVELAGMIRRLNRQLTSQQHWLLSTRANQTVSIEEPEICSEASLQLGVGDDPESRALSDEQHARLQEALAQLDPRERLLLKLRYGKGLTLKEVARLAGLQDPFRARYQIEQAVSRLREFLPD